MCTCTLLYQSLLKGPDYLRLLFMGGKLIPSVSILTDNFCLHLGVWGRGEGGMMGGVWEGGLFLVRNVV